MAHNFKFSLIPPLKREFLSTMLQFEIVEDKCTKCGLCAKDCPVLVINLDSGYPAISPERARNCIGCQHCLAICPTAALSILGRDPHQSQPLAGNFPVPEQLETLIRGRRSVRHYQDENLRPELLQQLLDVAWQAPTGVNMRQVQFTVIDDRQALAKFREETYAELAALIKAGQLPEKHAQFGQFVKLWQEKGIDVLFRRAPHLLVASVPRNCPTPMADGLIALAYFELFAQNLGVGTVWNGLVKWAIDELVPELRERLGIPEDHRIGYVMAFGKPAVHYQRTIDHGPAKIVYSRP